MEPEDNFGRGSNSRSSEEPQRDTTVYGDVPRAGVDGLSVGVVFLHSGSALWTQQLVMVPGTGQGQQEGKARTSEHRVTGDIQVGMSNLTSEFPASSENRQHPPPVGPTPVWSSYG